MPGLLRAVRRQQGLTLQDLAARTGLSKSYLSKIERRRAIPSIAVALRVAQALGVDVAELFVEPDDEERIIVDRAAQRRSDARRHHAVAARMLGKTMSPFIVWPADAGTESGGTDPACADSPAEHRGHEFVFVHTGTVELAYGDQTLTLHPGDSAYFDASVGHRLRALGADPAEVVVVTAADRG